MFLQKNHFIYTVFICCLLLITSCKSVKTVKSNTSNLNLSVKELIEKNTALTPNFKTLQSKFKVTYNDEKKQQSHTLNLKFKKDEIIWINATLSIIRTKITPTGIAFYNKLDRTYFEGDFNYLSEVLGVDLNFEKLQNLLLGEAIFSLKSDNYKVFPHQNQYALQPKKQRELLELFYIINPDTYKISSQQLSQAKTKKHLQIDYISYQEVNNEKIPEVIKILALKGNEQKTIQLEMKSVTLNTALRYPFNIPSGFKKIKL